MINPIKKTLQGEKLSRVCRYFREKTHQNFLNKMNEFEIIRLN